MYVPGVTVAVTVDVPPLETMLPCSLTPVPLIEMSWLTDCGFMDWSVTTPALAVAVDLVNAKPELATGMLITWPLPLGREEPEDPPLDELPPQPAASTTTTSGAAASAHILRILMPRPLFRTWLCARYRPHCDRAERRSTPFVNICCMTA